MKGVVDIAEEAYGSLQFVIDEYCELKKRKELERYGLDSYSQQFFQALRDLRMFGRKTEGNTDQQLRIGHRIKDEILYFHRFPDDCSRQGENESGSRRSFYVINTYDGISMRFLSEWLTNGKKHVLNALRKSGGKEHELRNVNDYIEKVGISDDETIEPWDPAQYKHDRPTLILKGSADTVPAGGAAEYIFRNALLGSRTLIEFPDSGHNLLLPPRAFRENILSGTVRLDALSILPGETRQVLGTYRGRNPNEIFRIELKKNDLESNVQVSGFGIRGKNGNESLEVVILIENTGDQAVAVPTKWTLGNKLFSATISFDPQILNPRTKNAVLGTIERAWLNRDGALRPREAQRPGTTPPLPVFPGSK